MSTPIDPLIEFAANCACCSCGIHPAKPLLVNGGFEAFQLTPYIVPQGANPPETRYYQELVPGCVPGWTVTSPPGAAAGGFIQNDGALQALNLDASNCFNSPVGNQFVRLVPQGFISQTVTLEPGRYSMSFLQSGYCKDDDSDFGKCGAHVQAKMTGPGNSVVFDVPFTILQELDTPEQNIKGSGIPPLWRRVSKEFNITKRDSYTLSFTCGTEFFLGNVVAAAYIDAVCINKM